MIRRSKFRQTKHAGALRKAFTLFEVLLAVILAAVLVGLLAMTIHIYLTSISAGRSDVQQAQLARAILARMATDLRAGFRYTEQDVSSVASLAEDTGGFDIGSLDSGVDSADAASALGSGSSGATSSTSAGSGVAPPTAGLYGTKNEMQIDVSRVPRFDELDALLASGTNAVQTYGGDLRTVSYFLQSGIAVDASELAATRLVDADVQQPGGLMRREIDRVASLYSTQFGTSQLVTDGAELLAPEVTWIEFTYFDGTETWDDWDASLRGGSPLAVEIRIWLRPVNDSSDSAEELTQIGGGPGPNDDVFHLLVHLPSSEATSVDSGTGSTGTSTGGTSASGGTTTGTSGSGGAAGGGL